MENIIDVVAAVIENKDGKILIAQRNLLKSQGGFWEFPGGKIEKGESEFEAIKREIKEELELDIEALKILGSKVFNYPNKNINLIAVKCIMKSNEIILNEHENYSWVTKDEFKNYDFAPADNFILEILR